MSYMTTVSRGYFLTKRVWLEGQLSTKVISTSDRDYGNGLNSQVCNTEYQVSGTGVIYERISSRKGEISWRKTILIEGVVGEVVYGRDYDLSDENQLSPN